MAGFDTPEINERLNRARIANVEHELELEQVSGDTLREAYSEAVNRMLQLEDIGWERLGGSSGMATTLDQAKRLAAKISDYSESNPLLRRGKEIRNSYLFSDPYQIDTRGATSKITPQQRNVIDADYNQDSVFSLQALETIEGERYDTGTAWVLYDRTNKRFTQVPFDHIGDVIYNPEDAGEIWYVKREFTYEAVDARTGTKVQREFKEWYPSSKYTPASPKRFLRMIDGVKVNTTKRMIVSRVNRKPGYTFGVPDAFAATPWALAYSAYLRDGTKVLAALAEWVWKVTPKKANAAGRAATAIKGERGAGGTLLTDMDVQALPKASAVDLNTGRPLASQVAAALGISLVFLLADPGQSGAYGTAQTLADPNRRTMQARRDVNTEFLLHCLSLIGIKDPAVVWGKMSPGSDLDEMTLTNQAWGTGLFHDDEVRPRIAEIAQITLRHEESPEGFMLPNNTNSQDRIDIDADGNPVSTVNADGTNSQSNGVGRDNVGAGALSRNTKSKATGADKAVKA